MKLVEGQLTLIGNSELRNAYPIPEKGFKPRRDAAVARLQSTGVICLGRQGKFEYIPHSNIATREAATLLNQAPVPSPPIELEQRMCALDEGNDRRLRPACVFQ